MLASHRAFACSGEGGLESKHEGDPQLVEHGDSGGGLLGLVHLEGAVVEVEVVELLRQHQREQRRMMRLVLLLSTRGPRVGTIAVLEDVLLGRVPVEVEVQEELLLVGLLQGLAQFLGVVHGGMEDFARLEILSVEVARRQGTSVVTVDDAVGVQHRYDVDFEMLFQILHELLFLRRRRVEEEVHQALDHPGSVGFAGMYP